MPSLEADCTKYLGENQGHQGGDLPFPTVCLDVVASTPLFQCLKNSHRPVGPAMSNDACEGNQDPVGTANKYMPKSSQITQNTCIYIYIHADIFVLCGP